MDWRLILVTSYSKESLETLPSPSILELPSFSEILEDNKTLLKKVNSDYNLMIEDDNIMPLLEAFAYRELHLRAMVNLKVKNMLPHYATGNDLDNFIFGFYGGVRRLKGAYPYATFEFKLKKESLLHEGEFLTISEGEILTSPRGERGRLTQNITLSTHKPKATGKVELLELIESSESELTMLNSYFDVEVKPLGVFMHGARAEDDNRFLERALLSLNRFSTAGAEGSYYYHIMNADVRVDTTYVYSPKAGVVRVILDNFEQDMDSYIVKRISQILNDDKIKPLTDKIEVHQAIQISTTIDADIKLFDLGLQDEIYNTIQKNFSIPLKINEHLTYSDIIQRLHISGVYSVVLNGISSDVLSNHDSRIVIREVRCEFTQAKL